jgi:phosphatidylglycerol:prolipoprotein diacylglycerol transferase
MYGLIITFSLVLCTLIVERELTNQDKELLWKLVFFMLLGGIIGARLYHVIHLHPYYMQDPVRILYVWQGGLGIIGGLFGAFVSFFIIAVRTKLNYFYWLDKFAYVAPLAHSLGRIANIVNGELLPYAIYESLGMLVVFSLFVIIRTKQLRQGTYSGLYLVSYGIVRIILEPTKQEAWDFGNIYVAQLFAIVFVIVGALILYGTTKK